MITHSQQCVRDKVSRGLLQIKSREKLAVLYIRDIAFIIPMLINVCISVTWFPYFIAFGFHNLWLMVSVSKHSFFWRIMNNYLSNTICTERRKERKMFLPLTHSLSSYNDQNCTSLKPGAQSLFQVSLSGHAAQGFEPYSTAFPSHKPATAWEVGQPGLEQVPIRDAGMCKVRTYATRLLQQALF